MEERKRLGLKAKDVAEHVGVAIPTQSNYEKGKRSPDTQYLFKLSELGFDLNYVVTGKKSDLHLDNEEELLLNLFRESPDSVKKYILDGLVMGSQKGILDSHEDEV